MTDVAEFKILHTVMDMHLPYQIISKLHRATRLYTKRAYQACRHGYRLKQVIGKKRCQSKVHIDSKYG